MKTHTLTSISLAAMVTSLGLVACGGAEIEPTGQQQASVAQPAGQTAPEGESAREAGRRDGKHRGWHGKGKGRGMGMGMGMAMGKHGPPTPEKMIERFDTNKNGVLEAAELPERMQERIGEIDTSGDSVVSKEELAAHFKSKFAAHAKARFDKQDTNKDGMLDQSELGDKWSKLSVADQNGDQKLTPEELRAAFEAGKLQRPEHRRHDKKAKPAQ